MPDRAPRACQRCGAVVPAGQPCPACQTTRRAAGNAIRAPGNRGYWRNGHRRRFRIGVLRRNPLCVLCGTPATVADHWPRTRRELQAAGADPDNPAYGRGLCKPCHDRYTALSSPGGWNNRGGPA